MRTIYYWGGKFLPPEIDKLIRERFSLLGDGIDIPEEYDPEFGGGVFYPAEGDIQEDGDWKILILRGIYKTVSGAEYPAEIYSAPDDWSLDILEG